MGTPSLPEAPRRTRRAKPSRNGQTLADQTVTIRYRDDTRQERLHFDAVATKLRELLSPA